MMQRLIVAVLMFAGLAGCAAEAPAAELDDDSFDGYSLGFSETTGVIRGIVVDGAIVPAPDVNVQILGRGDATTTDELGRFAFGDVPAGTHFLNFSSLLHAPTQISVTVVANVGEPALTKVQILRLFDQDPFVEQIQLTGYMTCGFSAGLSAPCVIDYTQLLPPCPGGCVQELQGITGDVCRFVVPLEAGWQSRISEMVWEPNLGTNQALSMAVSFFNRTTSDTFDGTAGISPLRHQMDMDPELTHPEWIPPEGKDDYLVFVNPSTSGSDLSVALMVEQRFDLFLNTFYFGPAPEGWSFVAGDPTPF